MIYVELFCPSLLAMSTSERSEGRNQSEPKRPPIEIGITPDPESGIIFERKPDTLVIRGHGEFAISMNLPQLPTLKEEDSPESLFQPKTGGTAPLPESSEAVRGESRALDSEGSENVGEITAKTPQKAAKSPVTDEKPASSGLVFGETSPPVSGQHTATGEVTHTPSETDSTPPEDETNRKYQLIGNIATEPYYRERKSGKAIADFVLATHDDSGDTSYHRVRAFGKQAVRVRDNLSKGMRDIEMHGYGVKTWEDPVKTNEGWTKRKRHGYYAGFIKVPKENAPKQQD